MDEVYVWTGTIGPATMLSLTVIAFLFNFIPAFIAFSRHHHNRIAILVMNFLFGWTGIGWIILLIWSLSSKNGQAYYRT